VPTIGEIADDINGQLEDVKTNTLGTQQNTNTIITQLTQLDNQVHHLNNTAQSGFSNLAQGLAVLIKLQTQSNDLLATNNKQNATIICWLDHIAHVACDIKHNTDAEVKLQKEISATLSHLDQVSNLVHSREAVEIRNQQEFVKRLEECCPTDEPRPQPCFKDCASPKLPDFQPIKSDWQPIRFTTPTDKHPPR